MPLFNAKKTTRGSAPSTAIRKGRATTKSVTVEGDKPKELNTLGTSYASIIVNQKQNTDFQSDSDSDDDPNKDSEVLPASDVTIYNTYTMGPAFGSKFPVPFIRYMVERVLNQRLKGKTYQAVDAVKWVRDVADEINLKMEGYCRKPRYKHVVKVIIYQQSGAGFFCGARAVWDELADDYVCKTFDGTSFMCIVTVFGCYIY